MNTTEWFYGLIYAFEIKNIKLIEGFLECDTFNLTVARYDAYTSKAILIEYIGL